MTKQIRTLIETPHKCPYNIIVQYTSKVGHWNKCDLKSGIICNPRDFPKECPLENYHE